MNTGFNYARMGLANNAGLADIENNRRWAQMESNRLNTEGKNAALGSLLGSVTGAGLAMYQANKKEADPTKVMDDPTQSDAAQETKAVIAAKERGEPIAKGSLPPTPTERTYNPEREADNLRLEQNPLDKLVMQRGVVDYSNPFALGSDWDASLAPILSKFPTRFFGVS